MMEQRLTTESGDRYQQRGQGHRAQAKQGVERALAAAPDELRDDRRHDEIKSPLEYRQD